MIDGLNRPNGPTNGDDPPLTGDEEAGESEREFPVAAEPEETDAAVAPGDSKAAGLQAEGPADDEGPSGLDRTIVEAFESELVEANKKADENWDRYLRAEAELENLRKRSERRRDEALKLQRRDMLARCLEVMDNLERALSHGADDPATIYEGVETTYRELSRVLERDGVAQMQAMDEPFDPEIHEAVGVVPLPSGEAERVVAIDRPGYTLGGEMLRPARVLVGQPVDGEDESDAS